MIQILLLLVVLVLTALAVAIGVQVFKLIRQLRQIADKINLLAKNDSQFDSLAHLVKIDKLSKNQEEKDSKKDPFPLVSVDVESRSQSSRSFYRNGHSLS